ncbi:MAG: Bor family protein [Bacteroidota bacterium]
MKRILLNVALLFTLTLMVSSCYTMTYNVGEGAKTGMSVTRKNHYLIAGLVPINTADPNQMAGNAKDYTVTIEHTFIDGLISGLTSGFYTPTTVRVTK